MEQRKAKTKMEERHHSYIQYDGNSKQSGVGQALISQGHLGRDVPKRIYLSEEDIEILWTCTEFYIVE